MARSRTTSKLISRLTGELAVTTLDFVVLSAALAGGMILYGPSGKDLYASQKTQRALKMTGLMYKKWDESAFRRAVGRAAGEGLVKRITDGFKLTGSGKKRLKELLPSYKQPKPWDEKLWLVTYDIPEDKRYIRDRFRNWLFEIGCRMIQESVWLSVKDPKPWIKDSIASMEKGNIIVSCLGKDGSIGNENLNELIYRVFELKRLNKAYKSWLQAVNQQSSKSTVLSLGFRFLSLLRQDPMFPKDLLPQDWAGNKARRIFETEIESEMGAIKIYLQK
ncbi:CRISPR-associated endonuclease Cas2 [Candidatus Collierbacteria bacterium]|nr:CRISPR-associated endonuclease Cas2 [Candidatus Collierbacteria bacterium]